MRTGPGSKRTISIGRYWGELGGGGGCILGSGTSGRKRADWRTVGDELREVSWGRWWKTLNDSLRNKPYSWLLGALGAEGEDVKTVL